MNASTRRARRLADGFAASARWGYECDGVSVDELTAECTLGDYFEKLPRRDAPGQLVGDKTPSYIASCAVREMVASTLPRCLRSRLHLTLLQSCLSAPPALLQLAADARRPARAV